MQNRPGPFWWNEELLFEAKSDPSELVRWRTSIYEQDQRTGLILSFNEHRALPWTQVAGPNPDTLWQDTAA